MALDSMFAKAVNDSTKIINAARAKALNIALAASGGGPTFPSISGSAITYDDGKSTTTSLTIPTHDTAKWLVVASSCQQGDISSYSTPSGWTEMFSSAVGGGFWLIYKKCASSSESLTLPANFSSGPGRDRITTCLVVADAHASTLLDTPSTHSTGGSDPNASHTVTPTANGDGGLLLFIGMGSHSNTSYTTSPPPSGWTLVSGSDIASRNPYNFVTRYNTQLTTSEVTGVNQGDVGDGSGGDTDVTLIIRPA